MKSSWKFAFALAVGIGLTLVTSLLLLAQVSVGSTRTSSQFVTTASSSTPQDAFLYVRRVLIREEAADPLLGELGAQLAHGLSNLPPVEIVERAGAGHSGVNLPWHQEGQPLPDLFLQLRKEESKKTGVFVKTTESKIMATLATAPWVSSYHYSDDLTPPVVDFQWQGRFEQTRETKGLGLNRPSAIAAEIAGQMLQAISNHLAGLRKDHPVASSRHALLVPPYQATPVLKTIEALKASPICSGPRLLSPNETYWLVPVQTNPIATLTFLRNQMTNEGWQQQAADFDSLLYLRLRQGLRTIECFVPSEMGPLNDREPKRAKLVVHYREGLDFQRTEECLEKLAQTGALEELLPFQHHLPKKQQEHFWQRMKNAPLPTASMLASLAEHENNGGNSQEARRFLAWARWVEYEDQNRSSVDSRLDSLEKKIGNVPWIEPSSQDLASLGFQSIGSKVEASSVERALNEPFRVAWNDSSGKLHLVSLILSKSGSQTAGWFEITKAERQGRSWSRGQSSLRLNSQNDSIYEFGSGDQKCRLRLRLADPGPKVKFQWD